MDLEVLQHQHRAWVRHNFPDQTLEQAFLGMVEEIGELAHAMLKYQQGIREHASDAEVVNLKDQLADAVGDLIIFTDGFCMCAGLDFPAVVKETWAKVKQRDWIKHPGTGLAPIEHLVSASPPQTPKRQRCKGCRRYAGFAGFNDEGFCPDCVRASEEEGVPGHRVLDS